MDEKVRGGDSEYMREKGEKEGRQKRRSFRGNEKREREKRIKAEVKDGKKKGRQSSLIAR